MVSSKIILGILGALFVVGGSLAYFSYSSELSNVQKDKQVDLVRADRDKMQGETDTHVAGSGSGMMKEDTTMGTGVVFLGGKTILEEGKNKTPLTQSYTFKSGVMVTTGGKVTKKDGTTYMLKEGESVWQDGSVMKANEMMGNKGESMMAATSSMMHAEAMMMHPGSYVAYAPEQIASAAAKGKVVLFFHASWCPTCRNLDLDIKAHLKDIPSDLTILDVDYDKSAELKKKYGITYQHTFAEVDANGTLIKKWSGSPTLAALVAEVK